MGKISAGPASGNDFFSATEDQIASGALFFNVLVNDTKKTTLYAIDDGQAADLVGQDTIGLAEQSRLGASIWLTSDGRIGYSLSSPQAQSLAAGETFVDSFVYAIRQASGALLWQTVQVTITGTNDGPVAVADVASATEDMLKTGSVALNDSDVDHGAVLQYAVAGTVPSGFTMASDGSWALDASNAAYQSLGAGQSAQLVVGYTVTDQFGARANSTLTINVTGTNDAPVASAATASVGEDGVVTGQTSAADADSGDSLVYSLVGNAPRGLTFNGDGSYSFDAVAGGYDHLGEGETATLSVDFRVTDSHGAESASTLTITIVGANDAPTAFAAVANVSEDGSTSGQLVATDPDSSANLVFAPSDGAPEGLTIAADGSWSFDASQAGYQALAAGETRDVVLDYVVTDDHGATSVSTLTVTISGTNDAPVAAATSAEASEGGSVSGQLSALDPDHGATLTFALSGDAPDGFVLAADGGWKLDASNEAYGALAAGEVRTLDVAFTATDDQGAISASILTIAVTGTNDGPVLTGAPATLVHGTEDTAYIVTQAQLLAGWTDPDGDALTATGLSATNAKVTANADGSFTITPAANFSGAVQLSYNVTDGSAVASSQAGLTIDAVNDAAVIGGTRSGTVTEATAASAGTAAFAGQLTISDVDSTANFQVRNNQLSDSGFGTFSITSAGLWTYRLINTNPTVDGLATGQSLSDTFTVNSADGTSQVIAITINGQTDPVYTPPPVSTAADSNDFDTLGDSSAVAGPLNYIGTSANNSVHGSQLGDTMVGLGGSDNFYAHGGDDQLWGDFQDPTTPGANFNIDRLYGQAGNDTLYGGLGGDYLYGGSGDDLLYANGSNGLDSERNYLFGGSGNDTIVGSVGGDEIRGGTGADTITGGSGGDRFFYSAFNETGDTITDYTSGWDAFDFTGLGMNYRFVGQVSSPFQLQPGQIGYVVSGGNSTLYVDGYGTEQGIDMEIHLTGVTSLSATDVWFG